MHRGVYLVTVAPKLLRRSLISGLPLSAFEYEASVTAVIVVKNTTKTRDTNTNIKG